MVMALSLAAALSAQSRSAKSYVSLFMDDGCKGSGSMCCVTRISNSHQSRAIVVDVWSKDTGATYARERVEGWSNTGVTATMCFSSCGMPACQEAFQDLYIKSARFVE